MSSRWFAFVAWAAVGALAVFWALRLFVAGTPLPAHAQVVPGAAAPLGDLSRVLGSDPAPQAAVAVESPATSRFRLVGVVAPRRDGDRGIALIAVDDKPARAYRTGAAVDGSLVLQVVHARGAALGPRGGTAEVQLSLPALPPPAVGVPTAAGAAAALPAVMAPPVPQAPAAPMRQLTPAELAAQNHEQPPVEPVANPALPRSEAVR